MKAQLHHRSSSLTLLFVLSLSSTAHSACFAPNGSDTTALRSDFRPCNTFDVDNSVCCSLVKNGGLNSLHDNCLSNGLCQWIYNGQTQYWRNGCSNSSWPGEFCLKNVCGDATQVDKDGNAALTPCDGTATSSTWCCGKNTTACCGKGTAGGEVTLKPTLVALVTSASASTPTAGLTAESAVSCPDADNLLQSDSNGYTYRTFCNSDSDEGSYQTVDLGSSKQGYSACFAICDNDTRCKSFTYLTNACYLKDVPGTLNNATSRVVGRKISKPSTTTTSTSSTSTSTSPGKASAMSSSSSGNSNSGSNDDSGLRPGVKAGIGIGAAALGLLLIGGAVFFILRHRRSKHKPQRSQYAPPGGTVSDAGTDYDGPVYSHYADRESEVKAHAPPPSEMPSATTAPQEMPADRGAGYYARELEGDSVYTMKADRHELEEAKSPRLG